MHQKQGERASRLVALLEGKLEKGPQPDKPKLRVVSPLPEPGVRWMDVIQRESHIRMIRSLRRHFAPVGMGLIVDQAIAGKGSLDDLNDDEILQLRRDMDRARECIADDITFEEAGLLRRQEEQCA